MLMRLRLPALHDLRRPTARLPDPADDHAVSGAATGRVAARWADTSFRVVALGAGLSVLAILALIAFFTTKQAWPIFSHDGWGFVTGTRWDPNNDTFGAVPFIFGTAVASTIALVVRGAAQHRHRAVHEQLAPRRVRRPVIYLVDLLAAIPSVVYGLWALAVLEQPARRRLPGGRRHGRQGAGARPGVRRCAERPQAS